MSKKTVDAWERVALFGSLPLDSQLWLTRKQDFFHARLGFGTADVFQEGLDVVFVFRFREESGRIQDFDQQAIADRDTGHRSTTIAGQRSA